MNRRQEVDQETVAGLDRDQGTDADPDLDQGIERTNVDPDQDRDQGIGGTGVDPDQDQGTDVDHDQDQGIEKEAVVEAKDIKNFSKNYLFLHFCLCGNIIGKTPII